MVVQGEGVARAGHWSAVLLLALGVGALLTAYLDRPGFFDNEGRYAEVAREMVESGDYVSPQMDYTLFLNKPPLLYWLTAGAFVVLGTSEWARLVTMVVAVLTLLVTARLGTHLFDARTGITAAALLAATFGFVLEARTLRPDLIVVATAAAAIACWLAAERGPEDRRTRWLAAMYALLGVGVLAKGLVPVAVAGIPIAAGTLRDHGWRALFARLRPGLGLVVFGLVILPWHVAVSLRHEGFAWDYVVNQHLLFFLDKKFPRDSVGDPLIPFLGAFVARSSPWIVLLPFTLREAWRGRRREADAPARGSALLWAWMVGVVGLFALAPSRLEHYTLPALPAVALLAARGVERLRLGEVGRAGWLWLGTVAAILLLTGVVGVTLGPSLLERVYWIAQMPDLMSLVLPASLAVATAGTLGLIAVRGRRASLLALALAVASVPMCVIVVRAEILVEPLFSWKPLAARLVATVPREVEVVFESPEEYQLVGGLAFYARRPITLLEVPGFIPPTYLETQAATMFLPRAEFERRWTSGVPVAFVSDPQRRRDTPDGIVPSPLYVLGRFGDRWLLSNQARANAS